MIISHVSKAIFQRDSLKILRGFYVKIAWWIHSKKSISENFMSGEWGGLSRDRVDQVSIEITINFLKWLFTSIQKHVCFSLDIHFFQLPSYDQSLRNHWVKSSKITYMDSVKRFFEGDTLRVFPITVLEENAWKTRLWKRCWRFDRMIINFPKRSIPLKFVSMMRFWALFTKHFVFLRVFRFCDANMLIFYTHSFQACFLNGSERCFLKPFSRNRIFDNLLEWYWKHPESEWFERITERLL